LNTETESRPSVGIATLLVTLAYRRKYDRVLLLAGDGDFEDSIDHVKSELDKEVWIFGYHGSVSTDLQSYSNEVVWIDDFWGKIGKVAPTAPAPTPLVP